MLLNQATLAEVAAGRITLQFRRWKRPTVKAGGTLMTSIGQLAIDEVEVVTQEDVTPADAKAAGFSSTATLLEAVGAGPRPLYRVRLHLAGPDPRIALREQLPDREEIQSLRARLDRWDAASKDGPWTRAALDVIGRRPAVRAGDLADEMGLERMRFKTRVRKLKGVGLTESLEVGYRLSPRGEALLADLG